MIIPERHDGRGAGEGPAALLFLILLAYPKASLADVRWLPTREEPGGAEREVDALLALDGARRRWLAPPAELVERYRSEMDGVMTGNPRRLAGQVRDLERRGRVRASWGRARPLRGRATPLGRRT